MYDRPKVRVVLILRAAYTLENTVTYPEIKTLRQTNTCSYKYSFHAIKIPYDDKSVGALFLLILRVRATRVGSGRVGLGRVGSGRVGLGWVGSGRVGLSIKLYKCFHTNEHRYSSILDIMLDLINYQLWYRPVCKYRYVRPI